MYTLNLQDYSLNVINHTRKAQSLHKAANQSLTKTERFNMSKPAMATFTIPLAQPGATAG